MRDGANAAAGPLQRMSPSRVTALPAPGDAPPTEGHRLSELPNAVRTSANLCIAKTGWWAVSRTFWTPPAPPLPRPPDLLVDGLILLLALTECSSQPADVQRGEAPKAATSGGRCACPAAPVQVGERPVQAWPPTRRPQNVPSGPLGCSRCYLAVGFRVSSWRFCALTPHFRPP